MYPTNVCAVSSEGRRRCKLQALSSFISSQLLYSCSNQHSYHRNLLGDGSSTHNTKGGCLCLSKDAAQLNNVVYISMRASFSPICLVIWKPIPEPPPVTSATFPLRQSVRNGDCSAEELIVQGSSRQSVQRLQRATLSVETRVPGYPQVSCRSPRLVWWRCVVTHRVVTHRVQGRNTAAWRMTCQKEPMKLRRAIS